MKVAAIILTHEFPDVTADDVDALETWVGDRNLVIVNGAYWQKWENVRFGSARIEPGFPGYYRNMFRNEFLGFKRAFEYWPDSDWFMYTDYDCLVTSDAIKEELAKADRLNAWCVGNDLRRFDFDIPYYETLLNSGRIRHSYYMLGAFLCLSRKLLVKLQEIGYLDRMHEAIKPLEKSLFPSYQRWGFDEEMWTTAAVHFGASLYELACWKSWDWQWHQRYTDDPHIIYNEGEDQLWRGRFPTFSVRFQPEMGIQETAPEMCAVHPVKTHNNPIRLYQRARRNAIRGRRS